MVTCPVRDVLMRSNRRTVMKENSFYFHYGKAHEKTYAAAEVILKDRSLLACEYLGCWSNGVICRLSIVSVKIFAAVNVMSLCLCANTYISCRQFDDFLQFFIKPYLKKTSLSHKTSYIWFCAFTVRTKENNAAMANN